jgi:hypothetical protein
MNRASRFLAELFRRKVVRLLAGYLALLWILSESLFSILPEFGVPTEYVRTIIILGAAAVPLLAYLSWKYNLVPPALVLDTHDASDVNPMLAWAKRRHDNANAGHLRIDWRSADDVREQQFLTPVSIGRDSGNEIRLTNQYVSRFHAIIWAEGGQWRVRDLDSTNGTYIDGKRIKGIATLPATCELSFHLKGPAINVSVEEIPATAVSTEI